jgi:hypothetical protein
LTPPDHPDTKGTPPAPRQPGEHKGSPTLKRSLLSHTQAYQRDHIGKQAPSTQSRRPRIPSISQHNDVKEHKNPSGARCRPSPLGRRVYTRRADRCQRLFCPDIRISVSDRHACRIAGSYAQARQERAETDAQM